MASGKSFIGKKLSETLKYNFIDLDDYIEMKENKSIASIFKEQGELYFRKMERKYLSELLERQDSIIISLGGGTPCYYSNMDLIAASKSTKSVYLKVSIPTLVQRLKNEKQQRPLIAHIETEALLTEFIGKHLFERSYFYNQAQFTIDANKDVSLIIEDITSKLF